MRNLQVDSSENEALRLCVSPPFDPKAETPKLSGAASGVSYVACPSANPDLPAQAGYRSILLSRSGAPRHKYADRYRIGDKIGGRYEVFAIHPGGMGIVYGVLDLQTQLPRALKSLQVLFIPGSFMAEMFKEEAAVWVNLGNHPCIVRAIQVQFLDWQLFVVAEYIRGLEGMGSDLRSWLGHPLLTPAVAIDMALQVAQGMQYATRKIPGLVHRDLKPSNILVDHRRRAMVMDFGTAIGDGEGGAGTPAYMAPEQWRDGKLDQRTDIYAYGCILYEVFTGHRMFTAQSIEEWAMAHSCQMPQAMSALVDIQQGLVSFVFRCLAKDPEARPKDWDEVVGTCAYWFQRLKGQAPILEFSTREMTERELIDICRSLGNVGKFDEMVEMSERLVATYPTSVETWINHVEVLNQSGKREKQNTALNRVLAMHPTSALHWTRIAGQLYELRLGKTDAEKLAIAERTLAAYDRALAIDPGYSEALMRKGDLLNSLRRPEESLTLYEQVIEMDPGNGSALIGKAHLLKDLKRWKEAVEACERAIAVRPAIPGTWHLKGVIHLEMGNPAAALTAFNHAVALDPSYSQAQAGKKEASARLKGSAT